MATTTTVPRPKTIMRGIQTPEGFEREETTTTVMCGTTFERTFPVLRLTSPDTEIEIHFDGGRDGYFLGSGHVSFDTVLGRRSFDRYGVEDSFYVENPLKDGPTLWHNARVAHPDGRLGTVIDQGYEKGRKVRPTAILWDGALTPEPFADRVLRAQRIRRADVSERVNYEIRRIIVERIPAARARLARSERVPGIPFSVTPEQKADIADKLSAGGMYRFTPSGFGTGYTLTGRKNRYGTQHRPLARFFGVAAVWVETFDAD